MYTNQHTCQYPKIEFTVMVCECCFDVLLDDDVEYLDEQLFCHHCIEEVCK